MSKSNNHAKLAALAAWLKQLKQPRKQKTN